MTDEQRQLVESWLEKVRRAQVAQYGAANRARRRHLYRGVPSVILSAVAGAFVFADLEGEPRAVAIAVGLASIVVSILVGLQTFLRLPDSIPQHQKCARDFGKLKRRAQQALATPPDDVPGWIDRFREDWDSASEDSPLAPNPLFSRESS